MTSILKSRDIILLTEVAIVKAMIFPVVMYRCESWTIKKAECWRIDVFKLWCWGRFLRVFWTARRSNQSVNPKWNQLWISIGKTDAEASIQYFGHLMQRVDTLEKTLMLGKIENRRRRGRQRMRWLMASPTKWTWVWVNSGSWWWMGGLACCGSCGHNESDTTEKLNWNWTSLSRMHKY